MRTSRKIPSAIAVLAASGSSASFAQQEAIGQSTSMPIVPTMSRADVQAAVQGGSGAGQEASGQSEAAPVHSTLSADDVHHQAMTANHGAGREAPGQSTALDHS